MLLNENSWVSNVKVIETASIPVVKFEAKLEMPIKPNFKFYDEKDQKMFQKLKFDITIDDSEINKEENVQQQHRGIQ